MKMSDIPTKYEVLIEQYLRSILDISVGFNKASIESIFLFNKVFYVKHD